MNLFTTLSDVLGNGCTATITIAQKDGIMTVGVLPGNDLVKDAAKNRKRIIHGVSSKMTSWKDTLSIIGIGMTV